MNKIESILYSFCVMNRKTNIFYIPSELNWQQCFRKPSNSADGKFNMSSLFKTSLMISDLLYSLLIVLGGCWSNSCMCSPRLSGSSDELTAESRRVRFRAALNNVFLGLYRNGTGSLTQPSLGLNNCTYASTYI